MIKKKQFRLRSPDKKRMVDLIVSLVFQVKVLTALIAEQCDCDGSVINNSADLCVKGNAVADEFNKAGTRVYLPVE